jgi:cytosine/adenosine deaminase-related metal-dependent hydrolase
VFGLIEDLAEQKMESALSILQEFNANGLQASTSPHATYSLSDKLRRLLAEHNSDIQSPISIHNQETESEDELFESKSGKLMETFLEFGLSMDGIMKTGKNALSSVFSDLKTMGPLLLVHNSFTDPEGMIWANDNRENLFWCSCPGANLYIELRSPKVVNWLKAGAQVCLGTDSLASNHQLSILQEMELTKSRSPDISLEELITMATYNGAKALGQQDHFGRLKTGTTPGIINLSGNDIDQGLITIHVKVNRLA